MTKAYPNYIKGMECAMEHVLCMPKRGLVMQPEGIGMGEKKMSFKLREFLLQGI